LGFDVVPGLLMKSVNGGFMVRWQTVVFLFFIGSLGCANKSVEREVDVQAAEQPTRTLHGAVAVKGLVEIENSKALSDEQKDKLKRLHQNMMAATFGVQEETAKLKGLLFETIAASPYRKDKVEEIKRRLVSLNNKKMKSMFKALDETEKIIGYMNPVEKGEVYSNMFPQPAY
jgi:hypothetical protein